jgi:hypothetical protein
MINSRNLSAKADQAHTMFICGEVAMARCRCLIVATWEVLVPDAVVLLLSRWPRRP